MVPPAALAAGFAAAAIFLFARDGDGDDVGCATPLTPVPMGAGLFALVGGVGIATAVAGDMFPRGAHRGRRCESSGSVVQLSQPYRENLVYRWNREHRCRRGCG